MKIIGYSLIVYGMWLLVGKPFLYTTFQEISRKHSHKRRVKQIREITGNREKKNIIIEHLTLLLSSVFKVQSKTVVYNFIFLTITIFVMSTIFLVMFIQDLVLGLLSAIIIALIPYIVIRYRLSFIRVKTSYAFMKEFQVILQNYQTHNRDIHVAIKNSYKQVQDPLLKSILLKLSYSMKLQKSPFEFKEAVKVFMFSIGTNFAKRFGNIVLKSYLEQRDSLDSMLQLNRDIERRKIKIAEEKSKNLESVMLGISSLFAPIIAFLIAYSISGPYDFWGNFRVSSNFTLFLICCITGLISFFTALVIKNPKADI